MPAGRRFSSILMVIAGFLAALALVVMGVALYLYALSTSLPSIDANPTDAAAQTTIVYAADGSVIARWHGDQDRTAVRFEQFPPYLADAAVAIEDKRFYEHEGIDLQAIARAFRANAESREVREGGSTITQQLVKILYTDGERTLDRKIREALLANKLELAEDKHDVLAAYLNTVYFGNGAYGIESAARRYFDKSTSELTLSESALLAGVIRSPSRYDPVGAPQAARARRDVVLDEMEAQGYITVRERDAAAAEPMRLQSAADAAPVAPYFVEYVKQELIERLGAKRVYEGGLRVRTSLDRGAQLAAEAAARRLSDERDPEVALVAMRDSTGEVIALVGGRDFSRSQFNLATQGTRQPGSAFKPFVLIAALESGVSPDQTFSAAPYSAKVKDGVWKVENYENTFNGGSLTLDKATRWSVNAVYARLVMQLGPEKVVNVAKRLGITTPLQPDPAIALGGLRQGVTPLEMATAYSTIANGGERVKPTGVVRVFDSNGRSVYEAELAKSRVISSKVAQTAGRMLHGVIEDGTGTAAKIPTWAAGKTGTTQSYRDAWFVGWSEGVTSAVWIGYPEALVAMEDVRGIRVTGGSFPAQVWRSFMRATLTPRSRGDEDDSVVQYGSEQIPVLICKESMVPVSDGCTDVEEVSLPINLVPSGTCPLH